MEYFPQLKATYDKAAWPKMRDGIIKKLGKPKKGWRDNNSNLVSQILITEKLWERC